MLCARREQIVLDKENILFILRASPDVAPPSALRREAPFNLNKETGGSSFSGIISTLPQVGRSPPFLPVTCCRRF